MEFGVAFQNVLVTLLYILPGFLACKGKKVTAVHLPGLSGLLIYVCSPCLIFSTILSLEDTPEMPVRMAQFFFISLLVQMIFMGALYLVLRRHYENAKNRVMTICGVLGNVGFFGLPVIRALLPDHPEVACYSAMFMVSMNPLVFTMGIFCLTGDKKYVSLRQAVVNPAFLSFLAVLPLYLLHLGNAIPSLVMDAVTLVGKMTTPLCMFILGIRLASAPLKEVFRSPFVYLVCAVKMLLYPIVSYALVCLLSVDEAFRYSVLILCGAPCASVVLGMAEMYDSEQQLTANCLMVSTLLSFITIPLLTLLT